MNKKIYLPALRVRFPGFKSHVVHFPSEENEEVANVKLHRLTDVYRQWGYEIVKSKVLTFNIEL